VHDWGTFQSKNIIETQSTLLYKIYTLKEEFKKYLRRTRVTRIKKNGKCSSHMPKIVVCGYERGGTTLVTEILRSTNLYSSGFECAILSATNQKNLAQNFKVFNIQKGWLLDCGDMDHIINSKSYGEVYKKLTESSQVFDSNKILFDKTPAYMKELSKIIQRSPSSKYVVICRDPRAVIYSWLKRNPHVDLAHTESMDHYTKRYLSYFEGYNNALKKYSGKIFLLSYEKLCTNPEKEVAKLFVFLGISNTVFSGLHAKLFSNIHGNKITPTFIEEYKNRLPLEIQLEIIAKTKDAELFFYNNL